MQLFLARLRQVDHDLPFWQRVTSERARDAIAAAFLHDIGHGPLSHLFEDAMPDAVSHESWTERILCDPSSEVHKVLAADDAYLPQRVAELVRGKHALPYLAKAVSGTFDVDRCDYLLRDAHATGVRYGEFDLPWLLRSLRFDEGPEPGLAIDGPKGIAAIEAFILARFFMFQQVYFHKSTRAAEWMIGAILRRATALLRDGVRLPATPPAIASVAAGDTPSLHDYDELDDHVLLCAIHEWESASCPILADLCKRLRARALFKTIELFLDARGAEPAASYDDALGRAREIAAAAGLAPDVYVGLDVASDTPYADDASLKVMFPKGRTRLPSEVSFLLDRLRNETLTRARIIFAPELRDAMREALIR
jgi:HD superfamily phosphohydrolase